jgi:hypothetical protein
MKAREYSAQWDCTGWYGMQRRDLQNRRVQVRFLSHLPFGNPEMKLLQATKRWSSFCVYLGC